MHAGAGRRAARCLAAAALAAASTLVSAQSYPSKPVHFLVPFAAGGIGDITARVIAQKMSENLGQPLLIENRPSAGMIVAAQAALQAEPDGYTMLLTGNGAAVSAALFKSLPYDVLNDFTQVSTLAYFDLLFLTGPDSKLGSLQEALAYARGHPGALNIGTISIGSTQNLSAELFKYMAGIDAQIIPYKATPGLLQALRANDVQLAVEFIGPVMPQVRNGAVKALAISADRRFPALPGTPTVAQSGVPGYRVSSWNAVSVRAGTPRERVERLSAEVAKAVAAPEVKRKLQELGFDARAATPAQARELMAAEIAKWSTLIGRAKIQRQ